ncbi:MAG TPA: four helix bundle protein [Burkholderiales bacterium]|nr:four helix bundle protein [Burkholderiales bacterium]
MLWNFGGLVKSHKDLDVWRLAIDLAQDVYEVSKVFPRDEQFGMTSQMRRAAVSIAGNIAEGAARNGQREFTQFLYIALGSASEMETQLEIARRVGLVAEGDFARLDALLARVAQMLRGLIRSVKSDLDSQS